MNPWKGLRGLRKEVWVVAAASLINRVGMMVLPFLVLYLTEARGFSASRAGLSLTVYGVGGLVSGPLAGRLCDRVGAASVFLASLLASGFFLIVLPFLRSYFVILGVVFVWSLFSEGFRPAAMTFIADFTTPVQRKPAFSLYRLAINLGMSVGPAAGGFLALLSFNYLFAVNAATTILASAFMFAMFAKLGVMGKRTEAGGSRETAADAGFTSRPLRDGRFLYFALAMVPIVLVYFQISAAYPLYLVQNLKLLASDFGLVFTLNTALIILFEIPLNTWMIRWKHRNALAFGAFLCAAGFGMTGLVTSFAGIAATCVVWSVGEMITFPTASAALADLTPQRGRGAYMGTFSMIRGTAVSIGPWLGTAVLQGLGAPVLWGGAFAVGTSSAVMLWFVREPHAAGAEALEPATNK